MKNARKKLKRNLKIIAYIGICALFFCGLWIGQTIGIERNCDLCPNKIVKEPEICRYQKGDFYYEGKCEKVDKLLEFYFEEG